MLVGGFELNEPVPELNAPHALAMLRPWIDVCAVGSLTFTRLEKIFKAKELGRLVKPGDFFDFTRYRPVICTRRGFRKVVVPNSIVTFAKREGENDLVFLCLLEPHMQCEIYIDSVLQLLKRFGVERYCLIGSMYDLVPHTRPLLISGGRSGEDSAQVLERIGVYHNNYRGPTTICYLISEEAQKSGIETMSLIVHLPQYTDLEEDYTGMVAILKVLGSLYRFPLDESDTHTAEDQLKEIDATVQNSPNLKSMVSRLETYYDAQIAVQEKEQPPQLSPDIEKFLHQMENRFKEI